MGTAGMATRAAMVQHQARRDNMADVAAKDNSQVTCVYEWLCDVMMCWYAGNSSKFGWTTSKLVAISSGS